MINERGKIPLLNPSRFVPAVLPTAGNLFSALYLIDLVVNG
jgi:hypothetical protein